MRLMAGGLSAIACLKNMRCGVGRLSACTFWCTESVFRPKRAMRLKIVCLTASTKPTLACKQTARVQYVQYTIHHNILLHSPKAENSDFLTATVHSRPRKHSLGCEFDLSMHPTPVSLPIVCEEMRRDSPNVEVLWEL